MGMVFIGAITFTVLDYLVRKKWGSESGVGLLTAITLDGIPENLALGVALIGTEPIALAALAGSILLSNLPEAAGGAKQMSKDKKKKGRVLLLWTLTAIILTATALIGNFFLRDASKDFLSLIKCFAGGAIIASLAIEVFPNSFKKDHFWSGLATVLGLIIAFYLNNLGE